MDSKDVENSHEEDKEANIMPSVEIIECERVAYIKEMQEYLKNLKGMEQSQAKKVSLENLMRSQIIGENGEYTDRYEFTRMCVQKKR